MKTFNFYKLLLLLATVAVTASCVQDDDFDVPDTTVEPPVITGTKISLNALYAQFEQAVADEADDLGVEPSDPNYNDVIAELRQTVKFDFAETDIYVEGYVISNDEAGNFFEELVLQDVPENPNRGVKVLIDVNPLFTTYEFGRKVFVPLDGLTVGLSNGVFSLGQRSGNNIESIAESQLEDYLIRDVVVAQIVPKPIAIEDFSFDNTNLYIQLSNVQFNRNEVLGDDRKTFAAEPEDQFDGERLLESCATGNTAIFSTSTFADFKSVLLPQGSGSLSGILTLNFFGEEFNVVVNDPSSINFTEERCDPEVFVCTTPSGGGDAFFSESFEAFDAIEDYVAQGWTNVNVSGGNTLWQIGNFSNNNYAQISGFNSNEDDIDVWLVTPSINMDATTSEELSFDIQANFDNGKILRVLFSTDFTGDVTTATWQELDVTIPTGPSNGFGDFVPVGPVNLSCVDGDIHIAFLYEGSDPNATTRYHVDNIEVTGI
jgi:hypothetical protein